MVARKLRGNIICSTYCDIIALCRKKSKQQQQLPTGTTASDKETKEENSEVDTSFPADPTLLAYIAHVKQHIQPLPFIKDQVITLAM